MESVSILKDAAAAAIYGAQAAGGVMLVTTKKGSGKPTFNYTNLTAFQHALNVPKRVSLLEEGLYSNLARKNAGISPEYGQYDFNIMQLGLQYYVNPSDTSQYVFYNTKDLLRQIMRARSPMITHDFSVKGGTDKLYYLASFGYYDQKGIWKIGPDQLHRYNGRINMGAKISDKISLDSRVSFTNWHSDEPSRTNGGTGATSLLNRLYRFRERWPFLNPDGQYNSSGVGSGVDSWAVLDAGGYQKNINNNLDGVSMTDNLPVNGNFIVNSLVGIDNAAWRLYVAENNISSYDDMIPREYRPALGGRNSRIGVMFQVPYGMPVDEIVKAVGKGYFIIKIKGGHPGSQREMIEKDKARITEIYEALKDTTTGQTPDRQLIYTIDARLLFIEEPLAEDNREYVGDLEIRIGADESANDESGTLRRIQQGYKVIVLKAVAKTLSLSLKIAKVAYEHQVPCVCSDLTVNPILVDWHKNLVARLLPFPGLSMGIMETNGEENYRNWDIMRQYLPYKDASWEYVRQGAFELDDDFYKLSGGIFGDTPHYPSLFTAKQL